MATRGKLLVAMCVEMRKLKDKIENEVIEDCSSVKEFSDDDSIADPNFETSDINSNYSTTDTEQCETFPIAIPSTDNSDALQPAIKRRCKQQVKFKSLTNDEKVTRDKMKHPIRPSCVETCKKKCGSTFTQQDRSEIWDKYWCLKYSLRRKWLAKNVQIIAVNRRTVAATNRSFTKGESRKFFLPKDNKSSCVCRKFFLNTLGYSNDSVITELCAAVKKAPMLSAVQENRGTSGNSLRKKDRTLIINHINGYKPSVSHYRRHNAPNIKYLPRELTIQTMFNDFNVKHPGFCKIELYRQTLKSLHISLCMPKSDICVDCISYNMSKGENNIETPFANEEDYNLHKTKAQKATEKYHQDSLVPYNANVRIFSMDLQKVMLIPNMPAVKDSFFISRLVAFNLTFCSLKKNPMFKNYCSMWHEAIAERDGHNIVEAIFRVFEEERDVKEFIICSDNCTGQNKNWILYTSLVYLVNQETGPECVTLRYLTKGHTHMSADGIHGNIEKKIAKIRNIYDYNDLKTAVNTSRKNVHVLDVTVFHKWDKKKRQVRKNAKTIDPLDGFLLTHVVEVRFKAGSRCLEYKTDFDQLEYTLLDFLQKKFRFQNMPTVMSNRGLLKSKKDVIVQKLGPLMPKNRLDFWNNLPESDSTSDLIDHFDTENIETN